MFKLNVILFILLQLKYIYTYRLNPSRVVYAINCGSEDSYTSKDGFDYLPVI